MSDLSGILDHITITSVWRALGGAEPRYGRAPAIWRKTRDRNVSLSDRKGTWFDFVEGTGGGVIGLVQKARGGSPKEAAAWLSDFTGVPLERENLTPAERKERARQWHAAQDEATELAWWKADLLEVLRDQRNGFLQTYHGAQKYLRTHPVEAASAAGDLRWPLAFDVGFWSWAHIERLQAQIDVIQHASYAELLPHFRARRKVAA